MHKCVGLFVVLAIFLAATCVLAENIDPFDTSAQYAYSENIGWFDFEPNLIDPNVGATVTNEGLSGFVWAQNIGWINLSPDFGGVVNDGTGMLAGYAWGENVGWISFAPNVLGDPNDYGVTIDHEGNFKGWAWGENIGWIHFRSASPVSYGVQTSWITGCIVDAEDLAVVANMWMLGEEGLDADLDGSGTVDFVDYSTLAGIWLKLCPAGWPLSD